MVEEELYWKNRHTNLEFWQALAKRNWERFPMLDDVRKILSEDIAAARHYGDTEAEKELLAFQQQHT